MNLTKKALISSVTAIAIATVFTGCGSDDNAVASGTTGAFGASDDTLFGGKWGSKTQETNSSSTNVSYTDGKKITYSGGHHKPFGVNNATTQDWNGTLSVLADSDYATDWQANQLTTIAAGLQGSDTNLTEAYKIAAAMFGIDPTQADADVIDALNQDTTALGATLPANGKTLMQTVGVLLAVVGNMNGGTAMSAAAIADLADSMKTITGATSGAAKSAAEIAAFDITTIAGAIASAAGITDTTKVAGIKNFGSLARTLLGNGQPVISVMDFVNNSADKIASNDSNMSAELNATVAAFNISIANNLEVAYVAAAVASENVTDTAGDLGTLTYQINDWNSNANLLGDISIEFSNEGNENSSYAITLSDLVFTNPTASTNDDAYVVTVGSNSNVSYKGINYAGTSMSSAVEGAMDANFTSSLVSPLDLNATFNWLQTKLEANTAVDFNSSMNGGNSNWSVTVIGQLKDPANNNVSYPLYGAPVALGGNATTMAPTPAEQITITTDSARTGSKIFDGNILK